MICKVYRLFGRRNSESVCDTSSDVLIRDGKNNDRNILIIIIMILKVIIRIIEMVRILMQIRIITIMLIVMTIIIVIIIKNNIYTETTRTETK